MQRKYRLLFIHPGPVPPKQDKTKNVYYHLSPYCEGDILTTRWRTSFDNVHPKPSRPFEEFLGSFRYHATRSTKFPGLIRPLWNICYFIRRGIALVKHGGRYDAIIAYGPHATAIAGLILSRLFDSKLIIDVPGHPVDPFLHHNNFFGTLKNKASRLIAPALLKRADAIKLLYQSQLDNLIAHHPRPVEIFHNFVPVSTIKATFPSPSEGRYILFLGYPWFLKGVDILIRSFNKISHKYPDVELRIIGHCPDRRPFEELAGNNRQITFYRAVHHEEAMTLMAGCSMFALPSRTEGMGRVLLEAMALKKPIIASRVGGIPTYVEDQRNGLLFESENVDDLAAKLDALLGNPTYAEQLAEEGNRRVFQEFSEEAYMKRFLEMLHQVVGQDNRNHQ